jgi:hypothetical protein
MIAMIRRMKLLAWLLALALASPPVAAAQSSGSAAPQPTTGSGAAFTPEEFEQVAAPIAPIRTLS